MGLDNSLRRLDKVVAELEKAATNVQANTKNDMKSAQIDLFGAPKKSPADNMLMAQTLDRTIERIENLLQAGSR
jgi:hypothetical protein